MYKIAFYSPLKPATHPVPSGDRLMARLLMNCLSRMGHQVDVASTLRAFLRDAESESDKTQLQEQAHSEIQRLSEIWTQEGAPDIWFCYHPYFKSPDLIGPELCQTFNVAYVTAEAAHSPRRSRGIWADTQAYVLSSLERAAVNICFTQRDRLGLEAASSRVRLASMRPFIDASEFIRQAPAAEPGHLVTVAMMRAGDKFDSYARLAAALESLLHLPWTLSIVGDGNLQQGVRELFKAIPDERIIWHGLLGRTDIAAVFARSSLYVWPGCGEAYGLAYLEAQAAALPVVAFKTAGVPEVIDEGVSGFLTPAGDDHAYARAIEHLLSDEKLRLTMAESAAAYVQREHTEGLASVRLNDILQHSVGNLS